jgi:hypothetical protein
MENLLNISKNVTQHTTYCNITNTIGLTEFGSIMKKL